MICEPINYLLPIVYIFGFIIWVCAAIQFHKNTMKWEKQYSKKFFELQQREILLKALAESFEKMRKNQDV